MENDPSEPSVKDLLERITQMEKLLIAQQQEINKFFRWMNDGDRLIIERIRRVERDQAGAFDRIKNLELTVFPQLAADVVQLHDIIGEGEDRADNPLDRRPKP